MTTMMRVSEHTKKRVMEVAATDFGGATADEAVARLLDEHWKAKLIRTVAAYREEDPEGWNAYLNEATDWDEAAPVTDEWNEAA